MTNTGGYVLASTISGMIGGAIGASAASGSHPVLKGSLVTGAVSGALALLLATVATEQQSSDTRALQQPRFP